jgi:hypothetical protein
MTEVEVKKLAEEYLVATGSDRLIQNNTEDILFKLACLADAEDGDKIKQLRDALSWDKIKNVLVEIISDCMPVYVLVGTEAGQFLAEHNIDIYQRISSSVEEYVKDVIEKIENSDV